MNTLKKMYAKAGFGLFMASASALSVAANSGTDWMQDQSGGKTLSDVTTNIDTGAQSIASLIVSLVTIGGFVVVALSLYQLYKASKDDREKPTSAIVGLFVGGAMAGVGSIMWIMKGTIVGN